MVTEGRTSAEGLVTAEIPLGAAEGELVVKAEDGDPIAVYPLSLGELDPVDEVSGYQARLVNLGYGIEDDEHGTLGPGTETALLMFQFDQGLTPTGEADDETQAALSDLHSA